MCSSDLSDGVILRSGAVVELFWSVGKDSGAIAPTPTTLSISGLLNSAASGCGGVGAAVISVLMASVIGAGEFWADAVSGK